MKNLKRRLTCIGLLFTIMFFTVIFLSGPSWAALILGFTPADSQIGTGDDFSIDVVAWGENEDTLAGISLDISFDDSNISFVDYNYYNFLGDGAIDIFLSSGYDGPGTGNISLDLTSMVMPDLYSGETFFADQFIDPAIPVTLATLTLKGLSAGSFDFSLAQALLWDEWGNSVSPAGLGTATINVTDSPVLVPEPSSLFLLGLGLAGLIGTGRRQKKL